LPPGIVAAANLFAAGNIFVGMGMPTYPAVAQKKGPAVVGSQTRRAATLCRRVSLPPSIVAAANLFAAGSIFVGMGMPTYPAVAQKKGPAVGPCPGSWDAG
jgi:hypothetical protein